MKYITIVIILMFLMSCSVSKNIRIVKTENDYLITSKGDTIPSKERLVRLMKPNYNYNLRMVKGRCVDARQLKNKNGKK